MARAVTALASEYPFQTKRFAPAEVELEVLKAVQRADASPECRDVTELFAHAEVELEVLESLQRADLLPERRDVAELACGRD